jgi:curved DNA-binding protein
MAVAFRDYYDILGVDRDASPEDIRRAYRQLARKHHPDVSKKPGAEDRFKEISEAYEVLRDPEKRSRYDRLGRNWKAGEDVSSAEGFDPGGFGGSGFGQGDYGDVRVEFGSGADFSDFFESMFGGRGRRSGFNGFSSRGGDHEATLELTLEEAAKGGRRKITLADGRDYDVNIPAGVREGQRIRLAGEGGQGRGGPAGDLFLRVHLRPHPRFRVEGNDIYTDVPITPWEAALGAPIDVPTLTGVKRVKVPPGSSSGRRLRLRGEGLAGGDLYAVLKIVVPKKPGKQERELFEQLAQVSDFNPREQR